MESSTLSATGETFTFNLLGKQVFVLADCPSYICVRLFILSINPDVGLLYHVNSTYH